MPGLIDVGVLLGGMMMVQVVPVFVQVVPGVVRVDVDPDPSDWFDSRLSGLHSSHSS